MWLDPKPLASMEAPDLPVIGELVQRLSGSTAAVEFRLEAVSALIAGGTLQRSMSWFDGVVDAALKAQPLAPAVLPSR